MSILAPKIDHKKCRWWEILLIASNICPVITIYNSELESDDPGGGALSTNQQPAPSVAHASMVQVGGATAVAAAMRERLEIINTQSQIEEIQSNLWNRNGQSQPAEQPAAPATNEPATSGKKKVVSAS